MKNGNLEARFRGSFVGVFVGDALGTTLEFQPKPTRRGYADPWHTEIIGGGPFGLNAGDFTDDGAMTLCLAKALAKDEPPTMSRKRQLDHYLRWRDKGFCSSNGRCFDIGNLTSEALGRYEFTGELDAPFDEHAQGNGALVRAVPVPLWIAARKPKILAQDEPKLAVGVAGLQPSPFSQENAAFRMRANLYAGATTTTHNNPVCVLASVIYSEAVYQALQGAPRDEVLSTAASLADMAWTKQPVFELAFNAANKPMRWEDFHSEGWVVNSLAIALWALREFDSFEEGMLEVVNMRGDADTNGAIYGGLAGAVYGVEAIPVRWMGKLKKEKDLNRTFDSLVAKSTPQRNKLR